MAGVKSEFNQQWGQASDDGGAAVPADVTAVAVGDGIAPLVDRFAPNNSEVHNAGEIWGTLMHEVYRARMREALAPAPRYDFDQARRRMADYLVAGKKAGSKSTGTGSPNDTPSVGQAHLQFLEKVLNGHGAVNDLSEPCFKSFVPE